MADSPPSPLALEEYRALRATIRERGTLRLVVIGLTFVLWTGAVATLGLDALLGLAPLAILATGFELSFVIHTGVERIGRYLQVYHEATAPGAVPRWEHAIVDTAAAGRPAGAPDGLFLRLFQIATVLSLAPVAVALARRPGIDAPVLVGTAGVVLLHMAFLARLELARRYADGQRGLDFEAFRAARSRRDG